MRNRRVERESPMPASRSPAFRHLHLAILPLLALSACGPAGTTTDPGATPAGAGGAGGTGGGGSPPATGGTAPTPAPAPPSPTQGAISLPMSVTAQFQNQGWFADPALEAFFQPGSMVIRQVDGTSGPCAARMPQARGKCLKVTYTPPAGLMPPAAGGWVGVYFLTTVSADHPEVMPPVRIGEANWGVEPGPKVAPGASKISFVGAADQDGVAVTFKAGTDKDSFVVPEQREVLGTAWKAYSLPLSGATYSNGVIGAFAWVLTDTSKAATFYLDNIVWE